MKILIADDHALIRKALRQVLSDPELTIFNGAGAPSFTEVDDFDAALDALAAGGADLFLIDLSMPGMAGTNSLRALREAHPQTKIVVITGWEDRATMLDCLGAGVHGYVLKSFATRQIVQAIEAILAGSIYMPPEIANVGGAETAGHHSSAPKMSTPPAAPPVAARFTKRQRDVLQLLGEGRSTKDIARALDLAEATVKVHLAAIYRGLNAHNRTEAVLLAGKLK